MMRKLILVSFALVLAYIALIQWKLYFHTRSDVEFWKRGANQATHETAQRVYSFSFSKYTENGERELEIEGDSADIFSQNVALINVIAKAYAEETPVTITADKGSIDRTSNEILLNRNVVASTENGARLMTDQLTIHPNDKRMETDSATKVKKDNINIEGMGAISDSELNKVKFKKTVTVVVQDPDSETKSPTVITSDGPLEIDYKRDVAHFSNNVVAHHDRGVLTADYMDVLYDKDSRRVWKIIARGNVVIESKEGNTTYSDNAVYLAKEGRVVLGGDVEAEYRKNESGFDESFF